MLDTDICTAKMSCEMSGLKSTQQHIPIVKMILNQSALNSGVTGRVGCASLYADAPYWDFLEQGGEGVNKDWINRWISWELRTGRSAGPLIHIDSYHHCEARME